ncbi:SDR family NAD(P)-dependent oxidoreductase [Arthrobacter sp. FW306-2-2C-D06B]|uniref:SDR family NAD(P)-dependent oxidoreductase n=1 Tax=Arthrobacter sp. FW306-2-2C-D06B TaxID=2879618 RepID=UPI001F2E41F4|nr:SDR family oxidoreductase [Arthrobacter sp. FW306-2-2C-D06B]UKA60471.1 SDR family oxidoreductase [Arthrobacter sp. FW306-2-2C-D06B]
MDMFGLSGKGALIIGGGWGIGGQTALALAKVGCNVAVVDINAEKAEEVCEKARELGVEATALVGDVLDDVQAERIIAEAEAALGGVDVLITVVGGGSWSTLLETSAEGFDADLNMNLRYVFVLGKAFAAACVRAGRPGAATFVSSVGSIIATPGLGPYSAAKAGLNQLVKSMAIEWAEHGIRVNAIAPGSTMTPRRPDSSPAEERVRRSTLPMQRLGRPEEMAGPILFLSSDLASYVTGQTLPVDGGMTSANPIDFSTPL